MRRTRHNGQVPEAVSEIDNDEYRGINYNALVSFLVKAMRELNDKVNHLEVEINKLNMISTNHAKEDVKVQKTKTGSGPNDIAKAF